MSHFKPVQRVSISTMNEVQKLQDLIEPVMGNFIEVTKSKHGSNIYHIRTERQIIKVYGFKDLDEQMGSVQVGRSIRISYKGSESSYSGGIKHFALVEIEEFDEKIECKSKDENFIQNSQVGNLNCTKEYSPSYTAFMNRLMKKS